ncbi:putative CAF1-binding domain-containing protein [Ordospora pajunii]|uniref:putative CAF1-binding domain-containing protein n=1 Tax=Ordospora pajunii TaxID=3039483 RepID=UPI0029526629|nr:putative CAF1-binding domain-containing protein [Ordospora pajunii]KAH9410668.1 putative CAF1-binding domain-containing protein [Ordospora pajunii]
MQQQGPFEAMEEGTQRHELKELFEKVDPKSLNRRFVDEEIQRMKKRSMIEPVEIARAILYLMDFPEKEWNLSEIVGSIRSNLEEINWREVYSCFLDLGLSVWKHESLYLIIDCWMHVSGANTMPYEIFFGRWKDEKAQVNFLRLIIEGDDKRLQLYSNVFFRRIVTPEESRNHRFKNVVGYESTFNCVELFECIGMLESVVLVELIARKSPEWCVMGLGYIQPMFLKIFDDLVLGFARGAPNSFVLHVLFKNHGSLMLQKAVMLQREGVAISKILDVFLENKMLPVVSELLEPVELCFDVIVLSSIRDHLNLTIWLSNNLTTRRDEFVKVLVKYLGMKVARPREAEKMFPLTAEIFGTFMRIVEQFLKILKPETVMMYNEFKQGLPQGLRMQKTRDMKIEEEASNFISQIINSQRGIESSICQIKEFLKEEGVNKELASKIFCALLENYSSLYKLPNSDLIAQLYGGLIKEEIFPKPYRRVAVEYTKGSLKYPENDREYSFGFKCLEVFLPQHPSVLGEIEEIESVRSNLVKKELVLIDSEIHPTIGFDDVMKLVFKERCKTNGGVGGIVDAMEERRRKAELGKEWMVGMMGEHDADEEQVVQAMMCEIGGKRRKGVERMFCEVAERMGNEFMMHFVKRALEVVKILLDYRCEGEIEISKVVGEVLGRMLLERNRIVTLEQFDFKRFVVKSVECRRILFGVTFVTSFLRQGRGGLVFRPMNPWMMGIFGLLSEVYSCTLRPVREEIRGLFEHFGVELSPKPFKSFGLRSKKYLAEYVVEEGDLVMRHVLFLALDLSVREISQPIIEKACSVAIRTGMELFKSTVVEKGSEYVLFRNMVVNLTRFLCFVSAQEPMKACISGNVSYFMKLCSLEFSTEKVFKIATENQEVCCELIQKAGVSRVNESINACYNELEYSTGRQQHVWFELLQDPGHIEKVVIKPVENGEYQEIKTHLVQLSKKIPYSKKNVIADEWHGLVGENREAVFSRIVRSIDECEDKDEECTRLCRYITGHLIKSGSKDDFLFECMEKMFKVSHKTQKEVIGWLIYSNDPRKFSVNLVSKFIEHNLINVVEYDQALSKIPSTEANLDFVISLLTSLITAEVHVCTVYDFICTLEMLAGHSDNGKVFDFFQRIGNFMMHIDGKGVPEYEEYVRISRFSAVPEQHLPEFMERVGYPESLDVRSAFKVSWDHFIRYNRIPTLYCYLKIDLLPVLVKGRLYECLKESLCVFVEAYRKRNYLFFKMYTRFVLKMLDEVEENGVSRSLVYSFLEVLYPSKVPAFTSFFVEIVNHRYVLRYFECEEGLWIAMEMLRCGVYSGRLAHRISQAMSFLKTAGWVRMYSSYLSYSCPPEYPHLKNLINASRDRVVAVENQNSFFRLRTALQNKTSVKLTDLGIGKNLWMYLIDNLNEMDEISMMAVESIKFMVERKMHAEEILTMLWIRIKAGDVPEALSACYNELQMLDSSRVFLRALESHGQ